MIGRETGAVALLVTNDSARVALHGFVVGKTHADCVVNTDEWPAYDRLPRAGRTHRTVHPGKRGDREWARTA